MVKLNCLFSFFFFSLMVNQKCFCYKPIEFSLSNAFHIPISIYKGMVALSVIALIFIAIGGAIKAGFCLKRCFCLKIIKKIIAITQYYSIFILFITLYSFSFFTLFFTLFHFSPAIEDRKSHDPARSSCLRPNVRYFGTKYLIYRLAFLKKFLFKCFCFKFCIHSSYVAKNIHKRETTKNV